MTRKSVNRIAELRRAEGSGSPVVRVKPSLEATALIAIHGDA
jgi:hypothetical protein